MRVPRDSLEGLRAKYAQMLAMRAAHSSSEADADDARAKMVELASRFPGALREIDDLELSEIRRRIEALDQVLEDGRDVEPWMEAVALFHAMTRGALSAKRWLAGRKVVDEATENAFARASVAFPEDARHWRGDLARIASPPRGRLSDAVFAQLAATLETTVPVVRRLVFGVPRRERRGI